MLPNTGTTERDLLDKEALLVGEKFLEEVGEIPQIPVALYNTYSHFRKKFLNERGLLDTVPGNENWEWDEALVDAAAMRDYVDQIWAARILDV